MKNSVLIFSIMCSMMCLSVSAEAPFPLLNKFNADQYSGTGYWKDGSGNQQDYKIDIEFKDNQMTTKYEFEDKVIIINLGFSFHDDGNFEVLYEGQHVGNGRHIEYSLPTTFVYEYTIDGVHISEQLYVLGGISGLIKTGSKQVGDQIIEWEEQLFNVAVWPPALQ